ncbi:long-chain-fatty-acid--CoA ligase, partial [Mycobacterium marinum]
PDSSSGLTGRHRRRAEARRGGPPTCPSATETSPTAGRRHPSGPPGRDRPTPR